MLNNIKSVRGLEIIISPGIPTIKAVVETEGNHKGVATIPIGTSRGKYEANYLYDNEARFNGKGMRKAVKNINDVISKRLRGVEVSNQRTIDEIMLELDGTKDKSKLGANAILAVSLAAARAGAETAGLPLFRYLGGLYAYRIPDISTTVIAGSKFSPSQIDFEDYTYVFSGFSSIMDSIEALAKVFGKLEENIRKKYGPIPSVVGGALAPPLKSNEEALDYMMESVSFFNLEKHIGIGIDIVGEELCSSQPFTYSVNGGNLSKEEYIEYLKNLTKIYPIVFLEDPFGEDDFEGFSQLTNQIGDRINIVGDDLFVTNYRRIEEGIKKTAGNAIIFKINQAGTLTEALEAARIAKENNFKIIASGRSSDSNDDFVSDIAVALSANIMKSGPLVSGERISKFNRLIEIEEIINKT